MSELPKVEIFTDGACRGNPGPGGWAALLKMGTKEREVVGGERLTTNNRMELIEAAARHRIDWHWVKGHSGHAENDRVDALACAEADRQRSAQD